tara:strand:+ start:1760 stop:1924 length:165 start_codon:yes stop_codon:yes gene_type:complete
LESYLAKKKIINIRRIFNQKLKSISVALTLKHILVLQYMLQEAKELKKIVSSPK